MNVNTSATGGYLQPSSLDPADDDALADALQSMVVGVTGLAPDLVRPRWQIVPPTQPAADIDWCGIGVMGDAPATGNAASIHTGDGGGSSISYHDSSFTVMASFYGPNSSGNANRLRDGLMIAQNREEMFRQGMALVGSPGNTTKTAELVNTQFIGRCDISFDIRRRVTRTWAIRNAAGVAGTVSADTQTPPHEAFSVPEG